MTPSSVLVLNTATNTVTATVRVGSIPGIAVAPTDAGLCNNTGNTVSVLNTATNTVTAWRRWVSPEASPSRLTGRGSRGPFDGNTVSVLDTDRRDGHGAGGTVPTAWPVRRARTDHCARHCKIGVYREVPGISTETGTASGTLELMASSATGVAIGGQVVVGDWNSSSTAQDRRLPQRHVVSRQKRNSVAGWFPDQMV
jgi:DNA-binding beta-propeller fold protein YncE